MAKDEGYIRVNVSFQPSVLSKLDKMADEMNSPRSEFIAYCVRIMEAMENKDAKGILELMYTLVKNAKNKGKVMRELLNVNK